MNVQLASMTSETLKNTLTVIPRHVGIIPDGNRRFSRLKRITYRMAYNLGYSTLRSIMKELLRLGVRYLSVYAMSYDNCTRRSSEELETLYELIVRGVNELSEDEDLVRNDIRVMFFGEINLLPEEIKRRIEILEADTRQRKGGILGVALCYSSLLEIEKDRDGGSRPISYKSMPSIDLIIRTGGQRRLSDFFPVNSRYAELYFTDKPWPSFSKDDLIHVLTWYQSVQRNFGR